MSSQPDPTKSVSRVPAHSLFQSTYRIAELAIVAMQIEEAFRSRFENELGFTLKKYFLNGSYNFTYFRGYTSGFGLQLINMKDGGGKSVTLTGITRTSRLTYWSIYFALAVCIVMFCAGLVLLPILGFNLPDFALAFMSFVIALFVSIVIYKVLYFIISRLETMNQGPLSDELMMEIIQLFRKTVEAKGELIEIKWQKF